MDYPWLVPLTFALSLTATALSWIVTRRHPEHGPVALLLTAGLAADVVRQLVHVFVMAPAHARSDPAPLTGWAHDRARG